jgi:hypothetical protein
MSQAQAIHEQLSSSIVPHFSLFHDSTAAKSVAKLKSKTNFPRAHIFRLLNFFWWNFYLHLVDPTANT